MVQQKPKESFTWDSSWFELGEELSLFSQKTILCSSLWKLHRNGTLSQDYHNCHVMSLATFEAHNFLVWFLSGELSKAKLKPLKKNSNSANLIILWNVLMFRSWIANLIFTFWKVKTSVPSFQRKKIYFILVIYFSRVSNIFLKPHFEQAHREVSQTLFQNFETPQDAHNGLHFFTLMRMCLNLKTLSWFKCELKVKVVTQLHQIIEECVEHNWNQN